MEDDSKFFQNGTVYQFYSNTIENLTSRRIKAHNFFLTINMALMSLFLLLVKSKDFSELGKVIFCCASLVGIIVNIFYCIYVYRFKKILKMKYDILQQIEQKMNLLVKPFEKESIKLKGIKTLGGLGYVVPSLFICVFACFNILICIYLFPF